MTVLPDRLPDLDGLLLASGAHRSWKDGACVMEAVAYIAGEPFTDHPKCASPIIGVFLRSWNDSLPDGGRHMTPDDLDRIHRYIATKEARRHQLAELVAEDWERRRGDYWPTGDGVGPYDLREPNQ